ncbi:LysR substrate-binding domain-containing protein [Pandoraea sputorum]|uniref:LysR family transcriptional regulator n=1 Tax=Pandoraea sputorum TaxID=93222 RepID=UPI001E2F79C8|nr:LysR substrate-binding domain-containing protein [Pandoraea sputorum]MCE4062682.1 LysR substrate-binding domain-containing protein [Pandoraea sputorum]
MDRFDAMRVFVRVVDVSSFTRAADSLDMATPTVSRLVKCLEAQTRVRLLNRTTRNVSPTDEGRAYYDACVRVLQQIDTMNQQAAGAGQAPEGRVKVALSAGLAKHVLIPALPSLLEKYPKLDVDIVVSSNPSLLAQNAVDCAVLIGDIAQTCVIARDVGRVTRIHCASPRYLHRMGHPGAAQARHMLSSRVQVDDDDAHLACAISGLGTASGYGFMLRPYLDSGVLQEVGDGHREPPEPVRVVYYPNRHMPGKLRTFIDWLRVVLEDAIRASESTPAALRERALT